MTISALIQPEFKHVIELKMSRFMTRALFILLSLTALPSLADGFDFEVRLNGKPIGHHQIRLLVDQTGRQVVQGDADYTVKLLGITFFAYQHQHQEIWNGNCLESLTSSTQTNGEVERLTLTRRVEDYTLETLKETKTITRDEQPCVWSYAYWRKDFTSQRQLMNGQTGKMSAVSFERLLPIAVSAQNMDPARALAEAETPIGSTGTRYKLINQDQTIFVDYSPSGDWIGLQVDLAPNRVLTYRLRATL